MSQSEVQPMLTVRDLQIQLGVSRGTAYEIAREIGIKIGPQMIRIDPERLREWLAARQGAV